MASIAHILGFLLLTPVPAEAAAPIEEPALVLTVGESRKIPLRPGETAGIQVEKTDALKVVPIPGGLRLIGRKPGAADIQTPSRRVRVSVLGQRQAESHRLLEAWARRNPGLRVEIDRGEVVLGGRAFSPRSWLGIPEVCPRCEFVARFEIPMEREDDFRRELGRLLRRRALPEPALRLRPQLAWSIAKTKASAPLKQLGNALGIDLIAEDDAVEIAPLVRTQIFVMEVRREFTRKYGISWPGSINAQVIPGGDTTLAPLGFSAQALENEGVARVLASPTILCRSGEQAEFLAGGEFPIKMLNYHAQDVVWKKYGIMMKVKPKADRWGRMSLTLETEISSIDPSRTVDGVPGLFTNRVSSHFDLEESATIAISGLIKNEDGKALQGLPGLARLPILGALFGSHEFRENRTELVIFVRPEVVDLKAERSEGK
ncbi:MAG: type II and III secretion system protein [Bdellovibrionaceae bacterium]|nr:type II and III secretion system protein [Pseudobdellovibrionaceae bacterium]